MIIKMVRILLYVDMLQALHLVRVARAVDPPCLAQRIGTTTSRKVTQHLQQAKVHIGILRHPRMRSLDLQTERMTEQSHRGRGELPCLECSQTRRLHLQYRQSRPHSCPPIWIQRHFRVHRPRLCSPCRYPDANL